MRRQHVAHRLRQLEQDYERELSVVLRLRVLRALPHQIQELFSQKGVRPSAMMFILCSAASQPSGTVRRGD